MRNPKRTSATAAALMIGVGLVGLITIFAASARTSVNAAIDRSMKADYVVNSSGFGPGTIPITLEDQLRGVENVESVSGVRVSQAKIKGSVDFLYAADPKKIDSLFDLQPTQGKISDLGPNGLAVLESTASDNNLHLGSKVEVEFPETGRQTFTVEAIFAQTGFANWVTSLDTYEANVADQFDTQIYVKTTGGVTPENTAALKQVVKQYPGPKLETREQFKATQAGQINQILNLIYVLLFFAIVIALFGIANTLGSVDHRAQPRARVAPRRRHEPSAGAVERAVGGGDHRPARHAARPGDRRRVRVGDGACPQRPGHRQVLARAGAAHRDRGAGGAVRHPRRGVAGPARGQARHPQLDPVSVAPPSRRTSSLPKLSGGLGGAWDRPAYRAEHTRPPCRTGRLGERHASCVRLAPPPARGCLSK